MTRHLFMVATCAREGRVAELHRWYDEQHIPDLLAVPGITGARRYSVTAIKLPQGVVPADALTIYDIDSDDPLAVMAELGRRTEAGVIRFTDALDRDKSVALIASPSP